MKDMLTLIIAGILLWWVTSWVDSAYANLVFEDNKAMIWIQVFSF